MANALYSSAKEGFLSNTLNWMTDPIVCVLVGTAAYTYSAAHATLADVPLAARIAVSGTLANRTASLGVADASDVTFGTVYGSVVNAVILCSNTGTDINSPLVAYLDTAAAGLPLQPNGNPVIIAWDNSPSKIFAL